MNMMKKIMGLATALFMGSGMAAGQTDKVVEELNDRGFWFPFVTWLQSDDRTDSYISSIGDNSIYSLKSTLETLDKGYQQACELLQARDKIGGKRKGKTQDERLARRFKDVTAAKRAFDEAEQVVKRYAKLKKAIEKELKQRPPSVMPGGRLLYFSFSNGNAFAGFHEDVTLDGRKEKNLLTVERKQMRWGNDGEEEEKVAGPMEVGDSVFVRVREMVEQGKLYEVGRHYLPDYDIMDASSWSMSIKFEQGEIHSGGYAEGPDHSDAVRAITQYLSELYNRHH